MRTLMNALLQDAIDQAGGNETTMPLRGARALAEDLLDSADHAGEEFTFEGLVSVLQDAIARV